MAQMETSRGLRQQWPTFLSTGLDPSKMLAAVDLGKGTERLQQRTKWAIPGKWVNLMPHIFLEVSSGSP